MCYFMLFLVLHHMSLRQNTLHSLRTKNIIDVLIIVFGGAISFYGADEHGAILIRWSSVPQVSGEEET